MIELKNDNCLNVLKILKDNSVDLVVTDCPYHIVSGGCSKGIYGQSKYKNIDTSNNNIENIEKGKIFEHNNIEFSEWLPDLYRILKNKTHCYIMINGRNLKELQQEAEKVGFIFQNLLVWKKNNATPNRYYRNNSEFILMLRKGKARNINKMATKNILEIPNIIGKKTHPTEKPVELMKILIDNSSNINDLILDPFMGTASVGVACKELGRKFLGVEIDEKYFKIAKERLENENNRKEI